MKLYWHGLILLIRKFVLRQSTGTVLCKFAEKMGIVYIKAAQIVAMQNYGSVFTEADRVALSKICDHCNPLPFSEVRCVLEQAFGSNLNRYFQTIDSTPIGSASISQVHRAVLKDGSVVAVKVKRQDVARRIERDICQIRRLIRRFGRMTKFRNFLGSDRAFDLYMTWILEETDFVNERHNLERYRDFAVSVNGRIAGARSINVPSVYPELCTDNVIVMEFIASPTINQLSLDDNKQSISRALNDYLSLSFYALLHDLPVIFHGDPHSGNIYLDPAGNLGFLDMGLIFELSSQEASFIRELFLGAYTGNAERLVKILIDSSDHANYDHQQFLTDIRSESKRFHEIPVTQFFVEMINIFTKYNIAPPPALFKTAKAFMALFGINNFIENYVTTESLLALQVREFYVRRTAQDMKRILVSGLEILPSFATTSLQYGLAAGLAVQLHALENLHQEIGEACRHCHEIFDCLGVSL